MKKHVLIGSVLLAAISSFSQTGSRLKPTGLINTKVISQMKFGAESATPVANVSPVKPSTHAGGGSGSKTTSITWQNFTSSMNIYGVVISYCKPLQWNDELNAVSFIHRKSPTYVTSPAPASTAATGAINAMISLDCGTTWDSTAVFQNNAHWGRYPGGAIYNPTGNTSISNAYVVAAGPTTGANTTTWIGNYYASKKLGTYDNIPSLAPGAQQIFTTSVGAQGNVPSRHDFAAYGFTATDDGKMRVLAGITDDVLTSDTAVMLMTGTFNTTTNTFDWAGKVFYPPTTVSPADNNENWVSRPIQAWNETGKYGYVIIMGSRLGATKSNVGMQPIVYKTTDFGVTWSLENGINFDSPAFSDVKMRLWASAGGDTIPNFYWGEGIDAAVDANNKLHIFTSVLGHASGDPDSLNFINQWGTEKYLWPHVPTAHPFLYDFVYDGNSATPKWSHMLIDSMSSEGPSGTAAGAGYGDNPWDTDPTNSNAKVRIDARLQMSRTADGKQLMYSWAESDTAFTDAQKKWNVLPNVKARLFDVVDDTLSPSKIDLTTDGGPDVSSHAMYHFVSPKFKLISKTATQITVDLPTTVSNSSPYAQLTTNKHWYACAQMDFDRPASTNTNTNTVGIAENSANSVNNSALYPNPAKNNVILRVDLASSSKVQIQVLNAVGQVVKSISSEGQTGTNSVNVDLNGLSSGIYFVNVKVNNASSTKKLVIE